MKKKCGIVGLTGGIACGKSTVSALFEQLSIRVFDADVIARSLVEPKQPALLEIINYFGQDVLLENGTLNRPFLRHCIFSNKHAKQTLETILHPKIYAYMTEHAQQTNDPYCIFSVPLLIETQAMNRVDRILVIDCHESEQKRRLQQRDGVDAATVTQILAAQCQRTQRLSYADDIICNQRAISDLKSQVEHLHAQYLAYF